MCRCLLMMKIFSTSLRNRMLGRRYVDWYVFLFENGFSYFSVRVTSVVVTSTIFFLPVRSVSSHDVSCLTPYKYYIVLFCSSVVTWCRYVFILTQSLEYALFFRLLSSNGCYVKISISSCRTSRFVVSNLYVYTILISLLYYFCFKSHRQYRDPCIVLP